jgi:hypothetical protein
LIDSLAVFVILNQKTKGSDFKLAVELKGQMIERLPADFDREEWATPRKIISYLERRLSA